MTRLRIAVACLFLSCCLLLPAASADAGPRGAMVKKVNEYRAKYGLRPFRHARSLSRSASGWSRLMMSRDFFGHGAGIRAPRKFRRLGETLSIHHGHRRRVSRTVRGWLASPGHRALLLSPSFRYVGAGISYGTFRGRRATIWVLHFGG